MAGMTTLACWLGTQGASLPKGFAGRLFGNGEDGCAGYSLLDDLLLVYKQECDGVRGCQGRRVNFQQFAGGTAPIPPRDPSAANFQDVDNKRGRTNR